MFALHARPWIFEPLLKVAAKTQRIWDQPFMRNLLEKMTQPLLRRVAPNAKIPKDLIIPRLAKHTLRDRYPELSQENRVKTANVAYFHGCAAKLF